MIAKKLVEKLSASGDEMTYETIRHWITNNPQKLIDEKVVFQFNEVEGDVRLVDGVAAGGPWMIFTFDTGPYAGKTIACTDDHYGNHERGLTFTYLAHASDDGMLFNKDPARFDPAVHDACGGDFIPELDGRTLTLVKERRTKMKATELIAKLQALIAEKGDAELTTVLDEDDEETTREVYDAIRLDHRGDVIGIYAALPEEDGEEKE